MSPITTDPIQIILVLAGAAFGTCILATMCTPLNCLVSQIMGVTRKKIFYSKYAKQLANMGTSLGVVCFTTMTAGIMYAALENPLLFEGTLRLPLMGALGMLAFAFALQVAYALTWSTLKGNMLHRLMGLLTALSMYTALFLSLGFKRLTLMPAPSTPATDLVETLLSMYSIPIVAVFWPLFIQLIFAGSGAAGALGLCYLLLRRKADNLGRDYYIFSIAHCARHALLPTILQTVPACMLLWMSQATRSFFSIDNPIVLVWAIGILLPLVSCGFWLAIAKSSTPLRHKPGIIVALLLLITGFALQLLAALHTYSLP